MNVPGIGAGIPRATPRNLIPLGGNLVGAVTPDEDQVNQESNAGSNAAPDPQGGSPGPISPPPVIVVPNAMTGPATEDVLEIIEQLAQARARIPQLVEEIRADHVEEQRELDLLAADRRLEEAQDRLTRLQTRIEQRLSNPGLSREERAALQRQLGALSVVAAALASGESTPDDLSFIAGVTELEQGLESLNRSLSESMVDPNNLLSPAQENALLYLALPLPPQTFIEGLSTTTLRDGSSLLSRLSPRDLTNLYRSLVAFSFSIGRPVETSFGNGVTDRTAELYLSLISEATGDGLSMTELNDRLNAAEPGLQIRYNQTSFASVYTGERGAFTINLNQLVAGQLALFSSTVDYQLDGSAPMTLEALVDNGQSSQLASRIMSAHRTFASTRRFVMISPENQVRLGRALADRLLIGRNRPTEDAIRLRMRQDKINYDEAESREMLEAFIAYLRERGGQYESIAFEVSRLPGDDPEQGWGVLMGHLTRNFYNNFNNRQHTGESLANYQRRQRMAALSFFSRINADLNKQPAGQLPDVPRAYVDELAEYIDNGGELPNFRDIVRNPQDHINLRRGGR